jgi:phosphatidylserine/phosphatidylglycerophosphate/cardiolipin synthase-like enzyme
VRLVFYRPHGAVDHLKTNAFWGSSSHVAMLERWAPSVSIRWDLAAPGDAQHQKCWLIDAGEPGEVAFVGGINLNPHSMVAPGHRGEGQNHDVYLELAGPSAVDVHHNLVQRWNDASERDAPGGAWGRAATTGLPFPTAVPALRGESTVQIQRTLARGRHGECAATPGGAAFDTGAGERSILDQYRAAIGAARQSIYIENQFVEVQAIVDDLRAAVDRGVEVAVVLPCEPDPAFVKMNSRPERAEFLKARDDLGAYDNFTLIGLAGVAEDGRRAGVYVHSKLMLVDDAWATVGSANLHHYSLFGNAEINASFADAKVVRNLRRELLAEHLNEDTSSLDSRSALRRLRAVAQANRRLKNLDDRAWQGLAFALDVESYGRAARLESAATGRG